MNTMLKTRPAIDRAKLEETIAAGFRLAREDGKDQPTLQDAIWQLIREAARTLKALPDRERGWLLSGEVAHWPACRMEASEAFGLAVELGTIGEVVELRARPPKPGPAAVDRLYVIIGWLSLIRGKNVRRDRQVLWLYAAGAPVRRLTEAFGCARRTVYDVRDRACRQIATSSCGGYMGSGWSA